MKKTERALVLTGNNKAGTILPAAAYQQVSSQLDAEAAIRSGLTQVKKGLGRPAEEAFAELEG